MTAALDPVVDRAVAGDDAAFTALVHRLRSELRGHCRQMLASPDRAEDALQEALLRAWRSRSQFGGRATFRTWLYRIATNACLDEIHRDRWWVGPDPDEDRASAEPGPDVLLETAEAIEDACAVIVALLPPRQRAVVILCEVLRCPSGEAARLLDTTVAGVNSARQRARSTLTGTRPAGARLPAADRLLLRRYVRAVRRHDVAELIALARADDRHG